MSLPKADLTFSEIRNPSILWCKTGHEVPPGTRMFAASGTTLPRAGWGDYCQYCVALVHKFKAEQCKAKNPPQEEEPEHLSLGQLKHRLKALGFKGIAEEEELEEIPEWEKFIKNCR